MLTDVLGLCSINGLFIPNYLNYLLKVCKSVPGPYHKSAITAMTTITKLIRHAAWHKIKMYLIACQILWVKLINIILWFLLNRWFPVPPHRCILSYPVPISELELMLLSFYLKFNSHMVVWTETFEAVIGQLFPAKLFHFSIHSYCKCLPNSQENKISTD